MISELNVKLEGLRENQDITSAYESMVNSNPYKVLANFSYDWEETPLGNVTENQPELTDVSFKKYFNVYTIIYYLLQFFLSTILMGTNVGMHCRLKAFLKIGFLPNLNRKNWSTSGLLQIVCKTRVMIFQVRCRISQLLRTREYGSRTTLM